MNYSRRQFVKCTGCLLAAGTAHAVLPMSGSGLYEAGYYKKLDDKIIECQLCPRRCQTRDGERGFCGVRVNQTGVYYTLVYGKTAASHIDPIEKKPLFHMLPGSAALSIATVGCNVMCRFCQNWELSQSLPKDVEMHEFPPDRVAALAKQRHCPIIAYTYNEPIVFTEYMYDTAQAARTMNLHNVMISNGYINKQPMKDLCGVLDAVKIDLKAFNQRFYRELVSGELNPVLDTLVLIKSLGMWTEIVYLVIPGENDNTDELKQMSQWIYRELGPETPLHFSRFYPQYRMQNLPPTPVAMLKKARNIALDAGLHYVYIGNVPGDPGENTYCPECGKMLIKRTGFFVGAVKLDHGKCRYCGAAIAGIWS